MNKQPVSYLQTDVRWKDISYAVRGEVATIGGSGCGPTSAAMLIETLTGTTFTPKDACAWALQHGYKALDQGTYYAYFVPQFAAKGIACKQLNTSRMLSAPDNKLHDEAIKLLKDGWYLIALMGPGIWTSRGHFVVVWWAADKFYINDPASTRTIRLRGDMHAFRNECRMYWAIDARGYNNQEEDDMAKIIEQIASAAGISTDEAIKRLGLLASFQDTVLDKYQTDGIAKLKELGFISLDRDGRAQVNWGDLGTVVGRIYEKLK